MLTSQCVVSTSLRVSIGTVICYSASTVNLIWFANEKCFSSEQHRDMNLGVSRSKNSSRNIGVHCLAWTCEIPTIATDT